jgi:hypothetical protein
LEGERESGWPGVRFELSLILLKIGAQWDLDVGDFLSVSDMSQRDKLGRYWKI